MMMYVFLLSMICISGTMAEGYGPLCTRCNQPRGTDEDVCNNQPIPGGNTVQCSPKEICTIDVRCDRKDRVLWIKGCEKVKGITANNTIICNDADTRCHYHCSGDYCNQFAPAGLVPSLSCTSNECDGGPMDICFALDMSKSIGNDGNWDKILNFTASLIDNLVIGEDMVRVGVVRFAGPADTTKDEELDEYDKDTLINNVLSLPYGPTKARTKTNLGLAACREILTDPVNSRHGVVPQVYMVVTDGMSTSPTQTADEVDLLYEANITGIAVGIGHEIDEPSVQALSPDGLYEIVDNFDDLDSITEMLIQFICGAMM